jgi:hypothetical protein
MMLAVGPVRVLPVHEFLRQLAGGRVLRAARSGPAGSSA